MSKKPWFPLYSADFDTDTRAWTIAEIGLYMRLLNHQWINGGLPNDDRELRRIAGADPDEWKEAWPQVKKKFKLNGAGLLCNQRLESERKGVERRYKQAVKAGKASGVARRQRADNKSEPANSSHSVADPLADPFPIGSNQSQSHSHKEPPAASRPTPLKRKTRLPEDWQPDDKLLAWAQKNVPQVKIGIETEIFRDYFLGSGGTKLDWRRTWQTWMRKEAKQSHKVKRRLTFEQAERICIREHKTKREGESNDEFIDRMQMIADGFG